MNRLTRRYGVPAPRLSSALLDACQQYAWPGNLRELENFAKRFLAHGDEDAALRELCSRTDYAPAGKAENGNGHVKTSLHPSSLPAANERSSLKLLVRNAKGEAERGAIAHALFTRSRNTTWFHRRNRHDFLVPTMSGKRSSAFMKTTYD